MVLQIQEEQRNFGR